MTAEATEAPAQPDKMDQVLSALGALTQILTQRQPEAAPVSPAPGSVPRARGMAQLAAPRQPDPEPVPPAQPSTPHPDETFASGEMGYYSYHRNGDPEGVDRVQLVMVAEVTDSHVFGLVLGDTENLAQFAVGQLTHEYPGQD